jgi:hypothetical protein
MNSSKTSFEDRMVIIGIRKFKFGEITTVVSNAATITTGTLILEKK